jgi:hypothetical protein
MVTEIKTTKPSKRGKVVDTHHVDQLIANYKTKRWMQNSKQLGKVDSLSTWYGLTELQQFLDLARENKADGIKMYYGVYPDNYETPELQGRQTVVLVATKTKQTQEGVFNKNIYYRKDEQLEILAFNLGEACPPFCGTGLPPDGDGIFGIEMEKIGISIINNGGKIEII